ncbi:MAG: GMP synthase-like glutamine amidotransferase [Parasphingorhabdus sp.]|jgi:GMP synthase-like glutamine amidotransferase
MSKQVCVFQHIDLEHPGIFREFLDADGHAWQPVELDVGEAIPDLRDFDALWVMGGPMDVWQEKENPWLVAEKAAIREAVTELKLPYLGFCLGHQLLAEALGGRVGLSVNPEIGILDVHRVAEQASPFLQDVPASIKSLQWHSAEVQSVPSDVPILMQTPACAIQAISYASHAFSVQFHVELTASTVGEWCEIPEYRMALEKSLGEGAMSAMDSDATTHMTEFNQLSKLLYDNWCRTTGF